MASPLDLSAAMTMTPTAPADWLVVAPLLVNLAGGALLVMVRRMTRLQPTLALALLGLAVAVDAALYARVLSHGAVVMTMGRWQAPFGITFNADALGALMALIAAVVGWIVAYASRSDANAAERQYGFYAFFLLLMAGIHGAFLTGDLFNLYVWFEVQLIATFGLMASGSTRPQIDATLKYAVLNLMATTFFLIGVGLVYGMLGTLNMADIARLVRAGHVAGPLPVVAALIFLGLAMKAAVAPVNFWLPASYHTPRLTAAALFAALLTKVGIYALYRVEISVLGVLAPSASGIILVLACLTMAMGSIGALAENDLRRIAGYLVINGIGVLLLPLAQPTGDMLTAGVFYAVHSMLGMAALFLVARGVGGLSGSFALTASGGLWLAAPLFSAASLTVFFAVAGFPPLSGFWPKFLFLKALIAEGHGWVAGILLVTAFLNTIVLGRVFILTFWRPATSEAPPPATPSGRRGLVLPVVVFALLLLGVGLYPEPLAKASRLGAQAIGDSQAMIVRVLGSSAAGGTHD